MKLKKIVSAAMAAVLSVAMLTACSGGGGGAGGGGGTAIKPTTYSGTRTYALVQEAKNKSVYMEYWDEGVQDGEAWKNEDMVLKGGSLNGSSYYDVYLKNTLFETMVNGDKSYTVLYDTPYDGDGYDITVEMLTRYGTAVVPKGKAIYLDDEKVKNAEASTGSTETAGNPFEGFENMKDSNVKASIGTYQGYYAEIFTPVPNPNNVSETYVYDNETHKELKAIIADSPRATFITHVLAFGIDSPSFNAAKLSIANYNAIDVTDAYIEAIRLAKEQDW